ncbi:hypothetical protein [Edaphobacter albus]|uniref:hypothetical protein n=1 Tax=Edaphobacter sp. 4G125 TaxID=2763071 RepID=UPI00351CAD70
MGRDLLWLRDDHGMFAGRVRNWTRCKKEGENEPMDRIVFAGILWCAAGGLVVAQAAKPAAAADSDHDGLSNVLEGELLDQFQPRWMISREDCSVKPARFAPGLAVPTVVSDDGTVYGQAFPLRKDELELHFYHLWRKDCGQMGHALDAEHVAVLLRRESGSEGRSKWRAMYWYAAAHEDTVCDASQITRASTLEAEDQGATVWISSGKHGSFLNEELCTHGCGGDHCADMDKMKTEDVVNLGEWLYPADGAVWVASPQWPLADKMRRSDFTEARVKRLERLPETDVAWANPSKRPAQAAIYGGNSAVNGVAIGGRSTDTALVLANDKTNRALDKAQRNTGNALTKSYRNVRKALKGAATSTTRTLGVEDGNADANQDTPK